MLKQKHLKLARAVLAHVWKIDQAAREDRYVSPFSVEDALALAGVKVEHITSGIMRTALIFEDLVIKIPGGQSGGNDRADELIEETRFIRKMRKHKKFGRHFPETTVIRHRGLVLQLQERVPNVWSDRLCRKYSSDVLALAEKLGIDDVHSGNYGWKGPKGKEYPVFIDVDFRWEASTKARRRKKRSWMVE